MNDSLGIFPAHITWLINQYHCVLTLKLSRSGVYQSIEDTINIFIQSDPSNDKVLVDWMVKGFCNTPQAFLWEDIAEGKTSKVSVTLENFMLYSAVLSKEQRNIYQYTSLADVFKAFKDLIPATIEPQGLRAKAKALAIEQSVIVYRADRFIAAVPLTENAAQWWGKGTQWCTASTQSQNYFQSYNRDAPLIVLVLEGKKYQLWCTKFDFQFMDDTDKPVDRDFIRDHWNCLEPIFWWLIQTSELAAEYFPEWNQTLANRAIDLNTNCIQYIPKKFIQPYHLENISDWSSELVDTIPTELMKPEYWIRAIKNSGFNIMAMPDFNNDIHLLSEFKKELLLMALDHKPFYANMMRYIIDEQRCDEIFLIEVIKRCVSNAHSFNIEKIQNAGLLTPAVINALCYFSRGSVKNIPSNLLTEDNYMDYIRHDALLLLNIPTKQMSKRLLKAAVMQNANVLFYIKDLSINTSIELFNLASLNLKNPLRSLSIVPPQARTSDFHSQVVKSNGQLLLEIKQSLWTSQMVIDAINSSPKVLLGLNEIWKNQKLCNALQTNSAVFNWPELFEKAARSDLKATWVIPHEFLTPEIRLAGLQNDSRSIVFLPDYLLTDTMVITALTKHSYLWKSIPELAKTLEVYKWFYINHNSSAKEEIPEKSYSILQHSEMPKSWNNDSLNMLTQTIQLHMDQMVSVSDQKELIQ